MSGFENEVLERIMTEKKTESSKMAAIRKKVEVLEEQMKALQKELRKAKVKAG